MFFVLIMLFNLIGIAILVSQLVCLQDDDYRRGYEDGYRAKEKEIKKDDNKREN